METPDLLALCLAVLPPVTPQTFWQSWVLAPETLLPVLGLFLLPWLMPSLRRAASGAEQRYWLLGCSLLAIALISPLCRLAATLAWAHMLQHLILIIPAPLALALGLRSRFRRRVQWGRHRDSLASLSTLLLAGTIWISHAPGIYEVALINEAVHLAVLAALVGSALFFWMSALAAPSLRAMSMVFVTILHSGLLGALLTFSSRLWYPVFAAGPQIWGLTPMEDQQLAGLIMWVPMGLILAAIGLWLWLSDLLLRDEPSHQ